MSSYLLFLAVGEFDRITTMAAGTEIGVVTKKGDGEKGRWALEGSAQILPYYNDYFGAPYPLPSSTILPGPGSSQFFGAMENWGAIFSFESILLNDPRSPAKSAAKPSSRSPRTKWLINGLAISSRWHGGTTFG